MVENLEGATIPTDSERLVEMAKDLLAVDTAAVLECLRMKFPNWTEEEKAFHDMTVAFHAARGLAEVFRESYVAAKGRNLRTAMEEQFQERMKEIEKGETGQ